MHLQPLHKDWLPEAVHCLLASGGHARSVSFAGSSVAGGSASLVPCRTGPALFRVNSIAYLPVLAMICLADGCPASMSTCFRLAAPKVVPCADTLASLEAISPIFTLNSTNTTQFQPTPRAKQYRHATCSATFDNTTAMPMADLNPSYALWKVSGCPCTQLVAVAAYIKLQGQHACWNP